MDHGAPYPRDLVGYGRHRPHAQWPGNARVAVQFVLNYEEGAESCVLHGDPASEQFLSEIVGAEAYAARHRSVESTYEYGSRAGVWRILREFERRGLPLTVFGVAMALERNPEAAAAFVELKHEIACHGWRWIPYQNIAEDVEREHMRRAVASLVRLTGHAPLGWPRVADVGRRESERAPDLSDLVPLGLRAFVPAMVRRLPRRSGRTCGTVNRNRAGK